jgi:hypothetical protein
MDRIPMRWPAEWTEPSRLEILKGTVVNCLVGEEQPPFPLGDIEFLKLDPDQPPDGVQLVEGAWPGVQASESSGDSADSGPTGAPWVDSNAGPVRLHQALEPDKKVWLTYRAPEKSEVVPLSIFPRPVAEAEAYNAHWVVDLHDSVRAGIENGNSEAMATWKQMMRVLEFASEHSEWSSWQPHAALAVVSDFEGENEFMAAEFLNLAPRRHLAYRVVRKADAVEASFANQKGIVYVDVAPPEGPVGKKLMDFAAGGGLLILPARPDELAGEPEQRRGYQVFSHGKGRVAVPVEEWYDPYLLAAEVHLLLSHREDVVRIWNGGMMNSHYVLSPDGSRGVVHLVEYGGSRSRYRDITIGFGEPYESAKVFTLEDTKTVKPVKTRLGVEIPMPHFSVYAAVEVENS